MNTELSHCLRALRRQPGRDCRPFASEKYQKHSLVLDMTQSPAGRARSAGAPLLMWAQTDSDNLKVQKCKQTVYLDKTAPVDSKQVKQKKALPGSSRTTALLLHPCKCRQRRTVSSQGPAQWRTRPLTAAESRLAACPSTTPAAGPPSDRGPEGGGCTHAPVDAASRPGRRTAGQPP